MSYFIGKTCHMFVSVVRLAILSLTILAIMYKVQCMMFAVKIKIGPPPTGAVRNRWAACASNQSLYATDRPSDN